MKITLDYILQKEAYRICRLLSTSQFVTFCKKRKIDISKRGLERLEELSLFYPIARTTPWTYEAKIRMVNERGGYENLGRLVESDDWNGETKTEYVRFDFGFHDSEEWISEGHLWDPKTRPFVKWSTYRGDDQFTRMESYYSPMQAYELCHKLDLLRRTVAAEFWVMKPKQFAESVLSWAIHRLEFAKKPFFRYDIAILCQVLSNRYYPFTQTNKRFINVSAPHDWNWNGFCDRWDAHEVLKELSLETADIRKAWELVVFDAKICDPMENWYDLVSFTAIEKRNKLKGQALRAQTWYAMEHMLRMFFFELTEEELPTPEGPVTYKFIPGAEKPVISKPLIQLEELTTDYNLNPRPALILLVEGESEAEVFPDMIERLFGLTTQILGIHVVPLKGVGNFDGTKRYDPQSAIIRFIDDYHFRGTIVFIVLDNEGRVKTTSKRLKDAPSIYQERMVTNDDYVVVWDKNIEFDNFTDQEIATAMSKVTNGRYQFIDSEIKQVRSSFGSKKVKRLEHIYKSVSGYSLEKPQLLAALVDLIPTTEVESGSTFARPILSILRRVINLARENRHQTSQWRRDYLFEKGLYGKMLTKSTSESDENSSEGEAT